MRPSARRLADALLMSAIVALGGCSDSTAPHAVVFQVERVPMLAVGGDIGYRFTVSNMSDRTIYLPTCDREVQLGWNIIGPGASRDAVSTFCPGNVSAVAVALEPGEGFARTGAITPRAGAQLQPVLFYSYSRETAYASSVTAPIL